MVAKSLTFSDELIHRSKEAGYVLRIDLIVFLNGDHCFDDWALRSWICEYYLLWLVDNFPGLEIVHRVLKETFNILDLFCDLPDWFSKTLI